MIAKETISVQNIVIDFSDFSHESSYEKNGFESGIWNWIEFNWS